MIIRSFARNLRILFWNSNKRISCCKTGCHESEDGFMSACFQKKYSSYIPVQLQAYIKNLEEKDEEDKTGSPEELETGF